MENSYSYSDSDDYGDEEASYQRRQQEAINELSSESSVSIKDFEMLASDRFYEHISHMGGPSQQMTCALKGLPANI